MDGLGTPKNLDELTFHIMLVPMMQFKKRVPEMIKDYIANKMATSVMTAGDPEAEKKLMDLFYRLSERQASENGTPDETR